ncbi:MAG TPA: sigma factor-like helix-turn-helix DNA-binding protein, partial [Candidatus Berkiella sp.]|nr:sigma factor-like helix-turn-helix DNA-binding protein [Candidatus Berkiella sp.]
PQNADPAYSIAEGNSEEQAQAQLQVALQMLDPRTLDIVSKRWLQEPKASLKELAESYDISLERVRQLENAGLKKLRTVFPLEG